MQGSRTRRGSASRRQKPGKVRVLSAKRAQEMNVAVVAPRAAPAASCESSCSGRDQNERYWGKPAPPATASETLEDLNMNVPPAPAPATCSAASSGGASSSAAPALLSSTLPATPHQRRPHANSVPPTPACAASSTSSRFQEASEALPAFLRDTRRRNDDGTDQPRKIRARHAKNEGRTWRVANVCPFCGKDNTGQHRCQFKAAPWVWANGAYRRCMKSNPNVEAQAQFLF